MMDIAIVRDLRGRFGAIRDQRARPTCLAFAASDAHAALRNPWAALSCEFLFYHAQRRQSRSHLVGATLPGVVEALREEGQPVEEMWPYAPNSPADPASWRPPQAVGPLLRCSGARGTAAVDAVVARLDSDGVSVLLINLSPAFYGASTGLVDDDPPGVTSVGARHAVIAVGHGAAAGARCILIRNSWGSGWGQGGYAWLTERYLNKRLFGLGNFLEVIDVSAGSNTA